MQAPREWLFFWIIIFENSYQVVYFNVDLLAWAASALNRKIVVLNLVFCIVSVTVLEVWEQQTLQAAKQYVEYQPSRPIVIMPAMIFVDMDEALGAHHHRADTGIRGDDFRNYQVSPANREHLPHRGSEFWAASPHNHGPQYLLRLPPSVNAEFMKSAGRDLA